MTINHDIFTETAAEKSVEPPPYSPLTPLVTNKINEGVCDSSKGDFFGKRLSKTDPNASVSRASATLICTDLLTETEADKSVEPPPYSPLTPCPLASNSTKDIMRNETFMNSSLHDDSTKTFSTLSELLLVSPIPHMSPDLAKMYNFLRDSMSIDSVEKPTVPDETISSLSSDDSIRDPHYCADDDLSDSSDDSSHRSVSLISGITIAEINQKSSNNTGIHLEGEMLSDSSGRATKSNKFSHKSGNFNLIVNENIVATGSETEADRTVENNTIAESSENNTGRPKKGRKRVYDGLSREERKKRKYSNLPYVNSKKELVKSKNFVDFKCNCQKNVTKTCQLKNI